MRADIRHARKVAMDGIKKLKGKISEDDGRRIAKEVRMFKLSNYVCICICICVLYNG